MPDVEPLRFPSREGRPSQQDQADFQFACTGRRRPCVLLNSPSPCVNKAVYHIQELRKTVEQWCQQSQTDQDKKCSKTLRLEPRDSDTESVTELFVEGIAICPRAYNTVGQSLKVFHPPESCPLSPLLKKINDVLGEVVYLIEQLEADRQYAEEAIQKEKTRKRFLESKIDSISLWKKQEHSFVVQKEHEACIRDNTELKWQLKLERQKLQQNQEKLSHTEVLNQRLHEDISFAKKQIPIVKENLDFQRDIINQINTAQVEADEEYSKTQSDLKMAQKEFQKFKLDANTEQKSQDSELFETKAQLAKRLEAVNNLKVYDEGLYAQIKDAEKVVALTEEKCEAITQHIPEMMELEKTEKDQSLQLKLRFEDEVQKNKKLKKKLSALQEDIEKTKLNREAEVSCIEEQLHTKRNTFALLHKENMVYEQNLEDFKTKISKSEKAVKQMREEKKQMLQKITDNDEQWEKAKEEATQVAAQHSVTQTKLKEQEQLTLIEQQRARKEIETLRKDLTSQMTEMEVLKGQCATISEELKHRQRSSELTNQKLQKEFEDASSATKALESKILNIKKLTEHLERIQCEHRNMLDNLEKEKKLKGDHLRVAKDLHTTTIRSYDSTLGRISDLTKKIEEYRDASDKMEKTVENMTEVIAELQSVFDVVDFRNKSAALIMSTLKSDINNCQQRTQRSVQTHTAHVTARKMKMEHTKEALKIALEENKRLAKEYECFKKILMEARQEAVSALSKKNHEQSSFHYYTQLSLLQKRMHKALVKYFKQRSLYSQAELDRCQALSQETDQKIKTAQEGLSEEIQLISAFLESLTDDSATTDDAGVNKQANPDAAGSNE